MKLMGWVLTAALAGGIVYGVATAGGCLNSTSPDERLAGRFDDLCSIAKKHVDMPADGVRDLGRYLGRHTGDMLGDLGETIQTIERIADDDAHDDRAGQARDRIRAPLYECAGDWQRFADAVENDPEASALVTRGVERLNRTLEIIFQGKSFDFKQLPRQLADLI